MNKLIDAALGIHPQALSVASRRLELLAGNIANADTPGYKARDIDFRKALESAASEQASGMRRTDERHVTGSATAPGMQAQYRIPLMPSLDGNTVDSQMEQSAFAEAAVRYQASLDFIQGRVDGLRKALRRE